jgi:hypothetical protein
MTYMNESEILSMIFNTDAVWEVNVYISLYVELAEFI